MRDYFHMPKSFKLKTNAYSPQLSSVSINSQKAWRSLNVTFKTQKPSKENFCFKVSSSLSSFILQLPPSLYISREYSTVLKIILF